jgi:hypothetical protein
VFGGRSRRTDENGAIHRTAFVDVHAINSFTSRIYIPPEPPVGTADGSFKIKNGDYYPISKEDIYNWENIYSQIVNRNHGMLIRREGDMTRSFKQFRKRLAKLTNLYRSNSYSSPGRRYLTDGGNDDHHLDEEYATNLVEFALEQRQSLLREHEMNQYIGTNRETDEQGLRETIARMEDAQHPSTFRISQSSEYILEKGDTINHLNLS